MCAAILAVPRFFRDIFAYSRKHVSGQPFPLRLAQLHPCLTDYHGNSGVTRGHYFYQDLHVARLIYAKNPHRHVDIGSRVDGFITHLLCFRNLEYVDIRPLRDELPGLKFTCSDATCLAEFDTDSVESISSLHAAEHFGLGRYGDPIDPSACFKFMRSLARVLAPGGRLYFSVPVGRQRLEFNGHRIFSTLTIMNTFNDLHLVSFCAVLDDGKLYMNASLDEASSAYHACGIFEFTKSAWTF
ncbi:MAG: DUF268 domain-containing protein [Alphaproteobacteria bacterium]|nr:DUF268 domain-containing protein [Alphaproteobacteria bacterium]